MLPTFNTTRELSLTCARLGPRTRRALKQTPCSRGRGVHLRAGVESTARSYYPQRGHFPSHGLPAHFKWLRSARVVSHEGWTGSVLTPPTSWRWLALGLLQRVWGSARLRSLRAVVQLFYGGMRWAAPERVGAPLACARSARRCSLFALVTVSMECVRLYLSYH
jgi:hypothetical protein